MKKSQTDRVLEALRRGPVGPVNFLPPVCDGGSPILRLAPRILELRERGHKITVSKADDGTAVYRLVTETALFDPSEYEQAA